MPDALLLFAALLANLVGMGWLALAMEPHWRQVRGDAARTPARVERLRWLGGASLAASLALCMAVDHPTMAMLVWVMALAAAALGIAFTLSWRARWLRVLLLRR
jgi:hypothetical protein